MEQAERKHVIFVFVYSSKRYFYLYNFIFTMFKKNANFKTIHHSQNNEFGFEKKKFLPQNNEVAIFGYTKTKEKNKYSLLCFAFWQINASASWKINYVSLFQLYQEPKQGVYMCWHWIKSFDTLIAEYQLHVSKLMP